MQIQTGSQEFAVADGKNFDDDNSGEFMSPNPSFSTNSPELSLLNFLPSTYRHSQFLATSLDFTTFFTLSILHWGRSNFYSYCLLGDLTLAELYNR